MLFSIILFSSLALSFILKGSYENIFIVLATMAFYKQDIVIENTQPTKEKRRDFSFVSIRR